MANPDFNLRIFSCFLPARLKSCIAPLESFIITYVETKCNSQIDVSFPCVCPVIDHEFRHNIVKVAEAIAEWIRGLI